MPLKDILVYVDESRRAAGTVAAACTPALRHDAHLTGPAVNRPAEMPDYAAVDFLPQRWKSSSNNAW